MSTSRRSFLARSSALALGSAALPWSLPARAAGQYPDKAVRLFVPYPPGAATDNLGRLAAQTYSEAYGQPFVVENRGGGGTTIGTRALAASDPDGYSIGMVDSAFTINPGLLGDKLPYDTMKDFKPISLMVTAPFVMVTHPSVKTKDLAAFIALAKAEPGRLTFGSAGIGSAPHLAGEQLRQHAGIDILHIPYRGGGTVFTDLLGGQLHFAFGTVPTLLEHIKSGALNAIAVTSTERVGQLPDVPTFREAGLPGVDTSPLFGLIAPADTPDEIVAKLSSTIAEAIRHGSLNARLAGMGFQPVGSTPEAFAQRIADDVAKWTQVIKQGGITPE